MPGPARSRWGRSPAAPTGGLRTTLTIAANVEFRPAPSSVIIQLQRNGFPLLPLQPSGGPVDLELVNSLREDGELASLELIATEAAGS